MTCTVCGASTLPQHRGEGVAFCSSHFAAWLASPSGQLTLRASWAQARSWALSDRGTERRGLTVIEGGVP